MERLCIWRTAQITMSISQHCSLVVLWLGELHTSPLKCQVLLLRKSMAIAISVHRWRGGVLQQVRNPDLSLTEDCVLLTEPVSNILVRFSCRCVIPHTLNTSNSWTKYKANSNLCVENTISLVVSNHRWGLAQGEAVSGTSTAACGRQAWLSSCVPAMQLERPHKLRA